jgi:hypothetical protein
MLIATTVTMWTLTIANVGLNPPQASAHHEHGLGPYATKAECVRAARKIVKSQPGYKIKWSCDGLKSRSNNTAFEPYSRSIQTARGYAFATALNRARIIANHLL